MPAAVATSFESSIDVYRRQARRLRCRLAGQPAVLQFALKTLAAQHPAREREPSRPSPLTSAPAGPARQFAEFLINRPAVSVLRYSERLELLRAARRFGIGRFEANLIIATVLERHQRTPKREERSTPPRSTPLLGAVATFFFVQGAVLAGAWWTMLR